MKIYKKVLILVIGILLFSFGISLNGYIGSNIIFIIILEITCLILGLSLIIYSLFQILKVFYLFLHRDYNQIDINFINSSKNESVQNLKHLLQSFSIPLIIFFTAGIILIIVVPYIFSKLLVSSIPNILILIIVFILIISLLYFSINYGIKQSKLNIKKLIGVYMTIYSSIIILSYFVIFPFLLYGDTHGVINYKPDRLFVLPNAKNLIDIVINVTNTSGLNIYGYGQGYAQLNVWGMTDIVILLFVFELVLTLIINLYYRNKISINLKNENKQDNKQVISKQAILITFTVVILSLFFIIPTIIDFSIFIATLTFFLAYLITIILILIVLFMRNTYKELETASITLRNSSLIVGFSYISLIFILIFNILFIIYMFVLTSLWPFKVIVSNPGTSGE